MIAHEIVLNRLLAYLNREITLGELVARAEDAVFEADFDPEETDKLLDTVGYLGAAHSPGFELTWEVCYDFLSRLGRPSKSFRSLPKPCLPYGNN